MKRNLISLTIAALTGSMILGLSFTSVQAADSDTVVDTTMVTDSTENIYDQGNYGVDWKIVQDNDDYILYIGSGDIPSDFSVTLDMMTKKIITKIVFDGPSKISGDISDFFGGLSNVTSIENLGNLDTSEVTSMSGLFKDFKSMNSIDLSGWNVGNVTDMSNMFANSGFTTINFANWNTSNVKTMAGMFSNSAITTLDLSGFNTNNLTNVSGMFRSTAAINSIKMFSDFSNVTNASSMFNGSGLETLNASGWNLSKANDLTYMFAMMPNLKELDVSNWQLNSNVNMMLLFMNDMNLSKLDISTWNNQSATVTGYLYMTGIKQITVSDTTALEDSYLGVPEDSEDGTPVGYWLKQNDSNASLIPAADFTDGTKYEGTYNYVKAGSILSDVVIKTSEGDQIVKVLVDADSLHNDVDVEVPNIDGYTPDKTSVKANVIIKTNDDGTTTYTIEVVDPDGAGYVTYTKDDDVDENNNNNNSGGSGGTTTTKPDVTNVKRLVSTHVDNNEVTLYQDNTSKVLDRALAKGTDWYSDQEMTKDGVTYYRVATNEWVKASDVYVYEDQNVVINTQKTPYQILTTSQGKDISSRALAVNTKWQVDRLAYINGSTYYRVATNEFVLKDAVALV